MGLNIKSGEYHADHQTIQRLASPCIRPFRGSSHQSVRRFCRPVPFLLYHHPPGLWRTHCSLVDLAFRKGHVTCSGIPRRIDTLTLCSFHPDLRPSSPEFDQIIQSFILIDSFFADLFGNQETFLFKLAQITHGRFPGNGQAFLDKFSLRIELIE